MNGPKRKNRDHDTKGSQWCALVSDAILFVYGISIPEDLLRNSLKGKLDKATVKEALEWAQAVIEWKTDRSDEAVWPGHITPTLWPLFWEVALRVDRERAYTALGYAFTAMAYREYDAGTDQRVWHGIPKRERASGSSLR